MHELAVVERLVEALLESEALRDGIVETVVVRRGSAFSEDALLQGFELVARGTPLEAAHLEIEVAEIAVTCRCGETQTVSADDLVGHLYVCAVCGDVGDMAGADDLELLSVSITSHPAER